MSCRCEDRQSGSQILVLAKEPVPGRVKTRLCPPLSPTEAARIAEAALADTLEAVASSRADRCVLVLDGQPGPWLPEGFVVLPQRGVGLAARLAAAWSDAGGPGLQIGMDTPQVTKGLLDSALDLLDRPATTAVLGLATDGGWWAIGMTYGWADDVFAGVPMSTDQAGAAQLSQLRGAGHQVDLLPELRDVDRMSDANAVAAAIPGSRFAAAVKRALESVAA